MSEVIVAPATERREEATRILKDLVHYRTYASTLPDGRKESREEVLERVLQMHLTKFPWLETEIRQAFQQVFEGRVVPSMRTLQFAGLPIFRSNARAFNCSYAALTTWKDFSDLFWLMMNGVGTGYSVQQHHISQLPEVTTGNSGIVTLEDTKEAWADGLFYLLSNPRINLDLSRIRPKGSPISSGGTASGPEPLAEAYEKIRYVLRNATGRQLRPIEAFDIMCYIADVVVVGGVRRAATISLFDASDTEMLTAKQGTWWDENPQRARANISAVVYRDGTEKDMIQKVLDHTFYNETGEPGIFLTNDKDLGTNPCSEISLRDHGLCNLSEINVAACQNEDEFLAAVDSATVLGTLQASYTHFNYIQPSWRDNNEEEALLGISLTGQAQNWGLLTAETLQKGAHYAIGVNEGWAKKLDIKPAKRLTTTKPSGSTSAWWGTTSGIHAAHSEFYLRRVRVDRKDAFGQYLIDTFGEEPANSDSFIETDEFSPENIIVSIPISMEDAIVRDSETPVHLMDRAKHIYNNWITPGHISGENTHNVSLTVNYHPHEEEEIREWMSDNIDSWAGISLLPYNGGGYSQAPFEAITHLQYEEWLDKIPMGVDFGEIDFSGSADNRLGEAACAGPNGCEIT